MRYRYLSAYLAVGLLMNACVGSQPINVATQPKLRSDNMVEFDPLKGASVGFPSDFLLLAC